MKNLETEEDIVKKSFQPLLTSLFSRKVVNTEIMVTPAMKTLYEMASNNNDNKKCIVLAGPPGLGKTTSLYWLYKQLQQHEDIFVMMLPFTHLPDIKGSIISDIHNNRRDRHMIVLVDLVSPAVGSAKLQSAEVLIDLATTYTNCKFIIAQSSSFGVYAKLLPSDTSNLQQLFIRGTTILLDRFNEDTAKKFLTAMGVTEGNVDECVKYCNGIPKLLALCGDEESYKDSIQKVQEIEFGTVMAYMANNSAQVNWENEINVLMAAELRLPINAVGLTCDAAKSTLMCTSHLLTINDGLPVPYFPINGDFLSSKVSTLFSSMNRNMIVKTEANCVIGHFFEYRIPYLLHNVGNQLTLNVKKLIEPNETNQTFAITLESLHAPPSARLGLPVHLPTSCPNTLWRTPKGYKAIDFILDCELKIKPNEEPKQTVIAMQVTVQAANQQDKITKSVVGLCSEVCGTMDRAIFVLINPMWTHFQTNYDYAKTAVSSRTTRSGVSGQNTQRLWYGQPANFAEYQALYAKLSRIFMVL